MFLVKEIGCRAKWGQSNNKLGRYAQGLLSRALTGVEWIQGHRLELGPLPEW